MTDEEIITLLESRDKLILSSFEHLVQRVLKLEEKINGYKNVADERSQGL